MPGRALAADHRAAEGESRWRPPPPGVKADTGERAVPGCAHAARPEAAPVAAPQQPCRHGPRRPCPSGRAPICPAGRGLRLAPSAQLSSGGPGARPSPRRRPPGRWGDGRWRLPLAGARGRCRTAGRAGPGPGRRPRVRWRLPWGKGDAGWAGGGVPLWKSLDELVSSGQVLRRAGDRGPRPRNRPLVRGQRAPRPRSGPGGRWVPGGRRPGAYRGPVGRERKRCGQRQPGAAERTLGKKSSASQPAPRDPADTYR